MDFPEEYPPPSSQQSDCGERGTGPVPIEDARNGNIFQQLPVPQLRRQPRTLIQDRTDGYEPYMTRSHANPLRGQRRGEVNPPIPAPAQETEARSRGSLTSVRKSRALPPALSSTVTKDTGVARRLAPPNNQFRQPPLTSEPNPLPHSPFEHLLPDSIPKPGRIAGKPLQELMLLNDHKPTWLLIRDTIRKHMFTLEVMHKSKHVTDGKPATEWVSPWITSRNPPADIVSMLCTMIRQDSCTSFMKKYDGDWGTIEIMKTCCKYRISNAIQNGERQPRDNYRHTARNSAKRNPNGLRGPKHGKAAKRRARDAQGTEVPPNSGSSITSIPSLSFDGMADSSDAQHQFEPLASNGSLSSPILQSPHVTHSYSGLIAHPAHVVDRRDDQPPLTSANHAQGMYGYHHQRLPHINLDQPLTGSTSQGSTTQVHLHHGQAIPNLAFMENMYRLKPDRTPSPFLHTNDAPGAGTRYDPRRD